MTDFDRAERPSAKGAPRRNEPSGAFDAIDYDDEDGEAARDHWLRDNLPPHHG